MAWSSFRFSVLEGGSPMVGGGCWVEPKSSSPSSLCAWPSSSSSPSALKPPGMRCRLRACDAPRVLCVGAIIPPPAATLASSCRNTFSVASTPAFPSISLRIPSSSLRLISSTSSPKAANSLSASSLTPPPPPALLRARSWTASRSCFRSLMMPTMSVRESMARS